MGSRPPGAKGPQNQLTWAHRGSQRWNQLSKSLYGSNLGSLHICYGCVAWCSCGTPTSKSGDVSDSCLLWGHFSSYWVVSSILDMRYVLCHVWLISLEDLLFSGNGGEWICRRREVEMLRREEGGETIVRI